MARRHNTASCGRETTWPTDTSSDSRSVTHFHPLQIQTSCPGDRFHYQEDVAVYILPIAQQPEFTLCSKKIIP